MLSPAVASAQRAVGDGPGLAVLLGQALLSLAVVVGIIYLVYFGLRRLDSRRFAEDGEGPMRVVQTKHLGGDRWLYLVEIDGRRIVIGAASGQIARVAELGESGGTGDDGEQ